MGKKNTKKTNSRLNRQIKEIEHGIIPASISSTVEQSGVLSEKESYTFYLDPVMATSPHAPELTITRSAHEGYGGWMAEVHQPCERRLDLMSQDWIDQSGDLGSSLLHFFAVSDIHITDGEFPGHGVYTKFGGGIVAVFSEMRNYTTHVLDAAIHSVNALHHETPFDFGLSLGDNANNAQFNELRWSIDVLDGQTISLDFGISPNERVGPRKDFYDEFVAVGLNPQIPWYQIIGNHDHDWPHKITEKLTADASRRLLTRREWMEAFFNTTSKPRGHGFTPAHLETGFACYTFVPKPEVPIKVIVVDNTQGDDEPNVRGYAHGSLDQQRFEWLVNELDQGQKEGQLMIIAAHVPIGVVYEEPLVRPFMEWSTISEISEPTLIKKLHSYPNLLAWVAGHRHRNTVTPLKSPDPKQPELGFWVIETASLRDFPQNFRTFEVVDNKNGTVSILTRNVSTTVKEGSFAGISRSYGVAAQQIFGGRIELLPTGSYNGELMVPLTGAMQEKIKSSAVPGQHR